MKIPKKNIGARYVRGMTKVGRKLVKREIKLIKKLK